MVFNHLPEQSGKVAADRLYLKACDTVTFAIGSNMVYNWDMISFYAWIDPEPEVAALYATFHIFFAVALTFGHG